MIVSFNCQSCFLYTLHLQIINPAVLPSQPLEVSSSKVINTKGSTAISMIFEHFYFPSSDMRLNLKCLSYHLITHIYKSCLQYLLITISAKIFKAKTWLLYQLIMHCLYLQGNNQLLDLIINQEHYLAVELTYHANVFYRTYYWLLYQLCCIYRAYTWLVYQVIVPRISMNDKVL